MNRISVRIIILAFLPIFAALAGGYYFFLRADYVPVFTALRAQQTASIAKVLSSKSIAFRLVPDGSAIEVPSDKVGEARLAIAGSDVSPGTTTGFELFNKSDMGLTDFAQKINYQRALQGELERTILSIDGIETARVHLALPEKSLFRSVRSEAKASVQIGTRSDTPLDPMRVASLQHLVASAVPDLEAGAVTVVDESGSLLSGSANDDPDAIASPETEERRAVQHLLRARLRGALQTAIPELRFDVKVLALQSTSNPQPSDPAAQGEVKRTFGVRTTLLTPYPLEPDQQARIEEIARVAIGYKPSNGDLIAFETGTLPTGAMPTALPEPIAPPVKPGEAQARADPSALSPLLLVGGALIGLCGFVAYWIFLGTRRRTGTLPASYHADLAARIRTALSPNGEARYGE